MRPERKGDEDDSWVPGLCPYVEWEDGQKDFRSERQVNSNWAKRGGVLGIKWGLDRLTPPIAEGLLVGMSPAPVYPECLVGKLMMLAPAVAQLFLHPTDRWPAAVGPGIRRPTRLSVRRWRRTRAWW